MFRIELLGKYEFGQSNQKKSQKKLKIERGKKGDFSELSGNVVQKTNNSQSNFDWLGKFSYDVISGTFYTI